MLDKDPRWSMLEWLFLKKDNSLHEVVNARSSYYNLGLKLGKADGLSGYGHESDMYSNPNGGEASPEAGISLSGKARDEWTVGYNDGFNATCHASQPGYPRGQPIELIWH
jgi:hypothetical protein